ncbi:MAG: hypothetical protein IKA79_06055 [Lentisphaeria bacterium]|nr:hypothetical protein [Lentisphaeria bacterium]
MHSFQAINGVLRPDIELLQQDPPLLFDPGTDAYYKVSEKSLKIISYMTEKYSSEEFCRLLAANGIITDVAEINRINSFLRQNNLLIPEYGEITSRQKMAAKIREQNFLLRFAGAYLFFRLPPLRPERFFEKCASFADFLVSKGMLCLFLFPALAGYFLAARDPGLVKNTFADTLSWAGLAKYFLAIVLLKILHEAAHCIAAIHFRCRVRGIGLGFMLFYPRLYTDTTDSWRLPRKQRLLIDSAGIILELVTGGIAALLWYELPPGSFRSTMFYIFAVSTLSTLLVNGNPLIRYDGYYILCDLLKIDNLMQRASSFIRSCCHYYFWGVGERPDEEKKIFMLFFGISAFLYRIFLYTSIILVIYYNFVKFLALIMLFLEFYCILFHPLYREIRTVASLARAGKKSRLKFLLAFLLPVLLLAGILFLPLSWGIRLPGEIVPSERMPLTILEGGFLRENLSALPRKVKKGELIFSLESPQLELAVKKLEAASAFDETLYSLQKLDENHFAASRVTAEKIRSNRIAAKELLRRKENLKISSPQDGIFLPALPELSPGAYLAANTHAGEIVSGKAVIHAYAGEREIGKIFPGMKGRIFFSDSLASSEVKVIAADSVACEFSKGPLLQPFGGNIPVYNKKEKGEGSMEKGTFLPVQTYYRVILEILDQPEEKYLSARTLSVKLQHREKLGTYIGNLILGFFRKEF